MNPRKRHKGQWHRRHQHMLHLAEEEKNKQDHRVRVAPGKQAATQRRSLLIIRQSDPLVYSLCKNYGGVEWPDIVARTRGKVAEGYITLPPGRLRFIYQPQRREPVLVWPSVPHPGLRYSHLLDDVYLKDHCGWMGTGGHPRAATAWWENI